MSREKMMGERVLRLAGLNPEGGVTETTLVLEPRSNMKVRPQLVGVAQRLEHLTAEGARAHRFRFPLCV